MITSRQKQLDRTGTRERPRQGTESSDGFERSYEQLIIVGGYENPVQDAPSGEGSFWFESYDSNIRSFHSDNAEELIERLFLHLGAVNIVRMRGSTWSVEGPDGIYGTISEIGGKKHSLSECLAPSKKITSKRGYGNCRAGIIVVNQYPEDSP